MSLTCCAPQLSPHYEVEISSKFTPEQQSKIIDALEEWKVKTSCVEYSAHLVDELSNPMQHVDFIEIGFDTVRPQALATTMHWMQLNSSFVRMSSYNPTTISEERFEQIVKHELGHAFGLHHPTGPEHARSIMSVTTEGYSDSVTPEDIERFDDVWHCVKFGENAEGK
jgi:hypothetical protein